MKNFILGFVTVAILFAAGIAVYKLLPTFTGPKSQFVSAENLRPGAKDFGVLKVEVFGNGRPLADVEVDLGKLEVGRGPVGPMTAVKTDSGGVALFERVPVGTYDIFWNTKYFPQEYNQPLNMLNISVEVLKDKTTEKKIELKPKQ